MAGSQKALREARRNRDRPQSPTRTLYPLLRLPSPARAPRHIRREVLRPIDLRRLWERPQPRLNQFSITQLGPD